MSTINERRLDDLSREIRALEDALVDAERDALDLSGDELQCEMKLAVVTAVRAELDRALRSYYIQAEFLRRGPARAA